MSSNTQKCVFKTKIFNQFTERLIVLFFSAAKCPPGFTSNDGLTDCIPCGRNTYWVNATHCESCPTGYKTDSNGVASKEGCKGKLN